MASQIIDQKSNSGIGSHTRLTRDRWQLPFSQGSSFGYPSFSSSENIQWATDIHQTWFMGNLPELLRLCWTFNNLLFTPLPHHIIIICLVICSSTDHEFLEGKGPAFSSLYPKCHRARYTEVKYPWRWQTYKPTNTTKHKVLKSPISHGSWFYSSSINANMEGSSGLATP